MRPLIIAVAVLLLASALSLADQTMDKREIAFPDSDGVQRVRITAGEYYFDPNVVVVKVNLPVELQVKKAGGLSPHNIVIEAPEAGIDFAQSLSSEFKTIRFTPTKVGRYSFECSIRFLFFTSHKERGMHGILEVVP